MGIPELQGRRGVGESLKGKIPPLMRSAWIVIEAGTLTLVVMVCATSVTYLGKWLDIFQRAADVAVVRSEDTSAIVAEAIQG